MGEGRKIFQLKTSQEVTMSNIPNDLKYLNTHEWTREDGQNEVSVGITDYAQDLLGDIVYVELPSIGTHVNSGEECAVIESVKAASDIYCPVSGEIIAINDALQDMPGLVNDDPYGQGWIFRVRLKNPEELNKLLDANSYEREIGSETH